MPVNPYFFNFPNQPSPESLILEELAIESIQIYGNDVKYLTREPLTLADNVYGEYQGSKFENAYTIEMYLQDVIGRSTGQSEFFFKFGLEIRDDYKVIVARRPFQKQVPIERPREGDLIWIPALSNMYEIKFVEEEKDFYSLGRRPPFFHYYELQLELFKFNNERFNTNDPEIDQIGRDYSYTIHLTLTPGGSGTYIMGETVFQGANVNVATATAVVKSYNIYDKTLDIMTIKGSFAEGSNVRGYTSNAQYIITNYNEQDFANVREELVDTKEIQDEADAILTGNDDEDNPFGFPGT